jgi:hypothetical protein
LAGGLDNSKNHVFDIVGDPAKPKLTKMIADLGAKTGYVGRHTADGTGQIREIYTTAFLMPPVVLNDIETILLAQN